MGKGNYPKIMPKGNTTPDIILHSRTCITLDHSSRITEAVAVRNGRIVAVGASKELLSDAGPDTRLIDLWGRTVVPGFYDAHPHMDREGLKQIAGIQINHCHSVADIVNEVRNAAKSAKPGEWIITMPMKTPELEYVNRPDQLREGRLPNRYDLDDVAPDNPVYIRGVWGWWSKRPFPSVANSMALKLAGVTRDTAAPFNTEILKDVKGNPTGVFLDRNFTPVLEHTLFKVLPRITYAQRVEGVRRSCKAYNAVGTTSGYEGHGLTPPVIRAYREIHQQGEMTVRLHTPYSLPTTALNDEDISKLLYLYSATASDRGIGDDMFRVEGVILG